MTTAERIAAINDRGQFEILATAVLRFGDPDCAGLIHAGINDAGETIAAPLDGFSVITHTTPPKGVFVAHTSTGRKELRGKLLTAADADLAKAAHRISECRQRLAGATAKIVLCINEPMGREEELYLDLADKAVQLKAQLEIWDRGRLAAFLDNDPNGQWIRQSHFGVSAQRPSIALLRSLGKRSIQALRDEVVPASAVIVDRSVDQKLDAAPAPAVTWLVGGSGTGKSVAALRHAERVLRDGGLAFYLPAGALHPGFGLAEALEHHLHALHPDFAPGVGDATLKLATEFQPLHLIIEDINRSEAGDKLGTRLAAWAARPKIADRDKEVTALPVHLIVPVWPELWSANARAWGDQSRTRVTDVGPFTSDEAVAVIQKLAHRRRLDISNLEAEGIAEAIGGDPFLMGLFSELSAEVSSKPELLHLANRDLMKAFLDQHAIRLARLNRRPVEDYADALDAIADRMLRDRAFRPSVQQVRDWLDQRQWLAISELLADGTLCRRIKEENGREFFATRHDRFLAALLARRVGQLLENIDENDGVLTDPFYAAIVGQAIAVGNASVNDFAKLMDLNQVAMFEAMRLVGEPSDEYQSAIADACQRWADTSAPTALDATVWEISRILMASDSKVAARAASTLPQNGALLLARFRNGDAEAGVRYVPQGFELYPATRDRRFEKTVDHVRMHRQSSVANQVLKLISSTQSTRTACGALALAGYLQVRDISSVIPDLMTRATLNERELLPNLLWVGLRCVPEVLVKGPTLLDRLIELPTGEPDGFNNEQWRVCQDLGWAGRHGYSHQSITTTIEWAGADKDRRMIAVTILEAVDDADAAEFVANVWAEVDYWGGLRRSPTTLSTEELKHRALSFECMARLQRIWTDTASNDKLRREAFGIWLQGAFQQQFPVVVAATDDPVLQHQALQWRVKSGDSRVTGLLIEAAHEQPFWWRFAHYVWSPVVCTAANDAISRDDGEANALWILAELLCDVPVADAEAILLANDSVVRRSEPLICTAAVLGTPKLQQLVTEALSAWTGEESPLRFAGMRLDKYRFKGGAQPLRFKCFEPFLDRVDRKTLESLGHTAEMSGAGEWAETHVWSRTAKPNGPAGDAGFLAELDAIHSDSRRSPFDVKFACDRFARTGKTSRKILDLSFPWVRTHLDERGTAIAGEVIAYVGGRDDIDRLGELLQTVPVSDAIERQFSDVAFRVRRATLAATAEDRELS